MVQRVRILAVSAAILEKGNSDSDISEIFNLTMGVGEDEEGDDDPYPEVADSKVLMGLIGARSRGWGKFWRGRSTRED